MPTPHPPDVRRVLLVDDESSILLGLRRLLGRRQIEITAVPTAQAALDELARAEFQAVIADFRMPGPSGLWLMEQVAQHHPSVLRILMSGYEIPDVEQAIEAGVVHHYAQKPIEMEELLRFLGLPPAITTVGDR